MYYEAFKVFSARWYVKLHITVSAYGFHSLPFYAHAYASHTGGGGAGDRARGSEHTLEYLICSHT